MRRGRLFTALSVLAVAASAALAGCGGSSSTPAGEGRVGQLPSGVVAQVGPQRITLAQLDRALAQQLASLRIQDKPVPAAGTEAYDDARRSALANLVAGRIFAIESARCGAPCRVPAAQVQREIDKVKQSSFHGSDEVFDEYLKQARLTLADVRALFRSQLQRERLLAHAAAGVRFTTADARAYYRSHRAQYDNPELRQARQILVPSRGEAERLRTQVTDANFADLAREHSIDPDSKDQGGDMGTILPGGHGIPKVDQAIRSLGLGEISQPLETQFGWVILQVTKITPPRTLTFAEVRSSIIETQREVKVQAAKQKWMAEVFQGWRKRATYRDRSLLPDPLPAAATEVTA